MARKDEIQNILKSDLSYEEKSRRLSALLSGRELGKVLPKAEDLPKLKEPLSPKTKNMRTLHLSIHDVYFEEIRRGVKRAEYRDYKDYYIQQCTYEENGKRYLVPFDAITFYVGRAKSMTVALTNIMCDGVYFIFFLGDILYPRE